MFLDIVVFLLLVLITLYLATQGMLSALLALATSIFASILAMALLEPLKGIIGGRWPDYARGVTFLLLYLLAFSATRLGADQAVPKNIELPKLVNRVAGGLVGFVTALVVVGTLILGFEMLPINRTVLGFDRFPYDSAMQAVSDGKTVYGEQAKPVNVWFAPDRFVLAIWNGASGRSLGGATAWSSVHPDLSVEEYGYRNQFDGSLRVLPADLFQVTDAWISADAKLKDAQGNDYPGSGKKLVMVRTEVKKGGEAPNVSSDNDGYLRVSATQVRLVTSKNQQYYPTGYLESGRQFVPLALNAGFIADDYVKGDKAIQDWIFQVAEDETPTLIEMKQLGRKELSGILKTARTQPLAQDAYPAHAYLKDLKTFEVVFDPRGNTNLKAGRVYLLKPEAVRADVDTSVLRTAHNHNLECASHIRDNNGGWSGEGKPGVPNQSMFSTAINWGQNLLTDPDAAPISWFSVIPMLLLGKAQPDPEGNLRNLPPFFDSEIVGLWRNTRKGNLIVGSAEADLEKGKAVITKISPGRHIVVVTMLTDRGFFVWIQDRDFAKDDKNFKAASQGGEAPTFQIDLDGKP